MASGFSVLYANKINDLMWRGVSFSVPSSYWVALFTASGGAAATALRANDIATAVEVTGGSYVRIEVRGATAITWAVSSGGLTQQNNDVTWPAATANWGTVYTAALMDASTAGNVVMFGDLSAPKSVSTPDIFKVPAGFFQSQF